MNKKKDKKIKFVNRYIYCNDTIKADDCFFLLLYNQVDIRWGYSCHIY